MAISFHFAVADRIDLFVRMRRAHWNSNHFVGSISKYGSVLFCVINDLFFPPVSFFLSLPKQCEIIKSAAADQQFFDENMFHLYSIL